MKYLYFTIDRIHFAPDTKQKVNTAKTKRNTLLTQKKSRKSINKEVITFENVKRLDKLTFFLTPKPSLNQLTKTTKQLLRKL